jgi:hypothetical protein
MMEELAKKAFILSKVPKHDTADKASTSIRNAGRIAKEEMTRIFTWENQAQLGSDKLIYSSRKYRLVSIFGGRVPFGLSTIGR